jgi:hypothetical protein
MEHEGESLESEVKVLRLKKEKTHEKFFQVFREFVSITNLKVSHSENNAEVKVLMHISSGAIFFLECKF